MIIIVDSRIHILHRWKLTWNLKNHPIQHKKIIFHPPSNFCVQHVIFFLGVYYPTSSTPLGTFKPTVAAMGDDVPIGGQGAMALTNLLTSSEELRGRALYLQLVDPQKTGDRS